MAGIYVHIPFCRQACTYCDFHFSTVLRNKGAMSEAIAREVALRQGFFPKDQVLDSLYFGGGTPSVLSEGELGSIFEAVHRHFTLKPGAEVTLEANPEDVTDANVKVWLDLGVNRLSLGVQSFFDEDLQWMNRRHGQLEAAMAVRTAQELGLRNLSVDLIFGLPGSSMGNWEANLIGATVLQVPHLSVYSLTVSERTALAHQVKTEQVTLPADEAYGEQFRTAHERLTALGYEHYELSSYAQPGQRAVHNSSYWAGEPYLGLGPSAHGYDGQQRYWNHAHNHRYQQAIGAGERPEADRETLSPQDRYHEYLITHLRHSRGIDPAHIEQALQPGWQVRFQPLLTQLQQRGLLTQRQGRYVLSLEGWMISDQVIGEFFVGD